MTTSDERDLAVGREEAGAADMAADLAGDPAEAAASPSTTATPRSIDARLRDHASIGRLADDLLPALIAKLGATALGEIEVREDAWKVRLRRPADALGPMYGRRSTDRPGRVQPGHAGHGHAPAAAEQHRAMQSVESTPASPGSDEPGVPRDAHQRPFGGVGAGPNGARHHMTAVGPGPDPGARVGRMGHLPEGDEFPTAPGSNGDMAPYRAVATSPAVGIFQSRPEGRPGTRVRAGDRIASVDVLGVAQPVLSPVDGVVGATLVDNGDPVEYGQELVRIGPSGASGGDGSSPSPVSGHVADVAAAASAGPNPSTASGSAATAPATGRGEP